MPWVLVEFRRLPRLHPTQSHCILLQICTLLSIHSFAILGCLFIVLIQHLQVVLLGDGPAVADPLTTT
jgi:hypothetical protein